ncbi:hypothetical protein PAXRUDRAFT_826741 [Paxillus rubicundulus Ve08.2h10]|uniref:Uncharacterized protein n=1 Tax=Paxillus rubicundulus Ve08.2h10 TaxID=930991 RepID=A0A0D0DE55_9AGAM|nr:hypothetical protein PAXRUDRAFT_826741 [Paxillus rubicundulus Ve08.2h10]
MRVPHTTARTPTKTIKVLGPASETCQEPMDQLMDNVASPHLSVRMRGSSIPTVHLAAAILPIRRCD